MIMSKKISPLLILVTILFLSACSDPGPIGAPPTLENGAPAPNFKVEKLDGKVVTLDDFKGAPLVLTFMASWCPCSNDSAPVFKEAYTKYHPQGVEFFMLGMQDSRSKFTNFVKDKGFTYPAAFDKGDAIARTYGVSAPPTTFFIDSSGKVVSSFYGKIVEKEKLSSWIDQIVALPPVQEKAKESKNATTE